MRRVPILLLLAMVLAAPAALGGAFTVSPTTLTLDGTRKTAVVSVRNRGKDPVLVQIELFRWTGALDSGGLEPTRELLAVPPVARIPPDGKQVVRVALRSPFHGRVEQAYRLLISEVPSTAEPDVGGVRFALRLSLPVFVTPKGAAPRPEWRLQRTARGLELVVHNRGTAHLRIRRLVLRPAAGGKPITPGEELVYVLPGGSHVWTLPAVEAAGQRFVLEAESQVGPIRQELVAEIS